MGLFAMVDRVLAWAQCPGLDCLHDGRFLGWDAGPEKTMVRPCGQPVFDDRRSCVFGDGRRDEPFIKPGSSTNFLVRSFPVGFAFLRSGKFGEGFGRAGGFDDDLTE